jgi:hypothetical protein
VGTAAIAADAVTAIAHIAEKIAIAPRAAHPKPTRFENTTNPRRCPLT